MQLRVCERLGWTWDELMDAPGWFVKNAMAWFNAVDQWTDTQRKLKSGG